jgi:hypothetical protein
MAPVRRGWAMPQAGYFPRRKVADMRNPSMHGMRLRPSFGDTLLLFRLDVA